jgi:hypothetical protein
VEHAGQSFGRCVFCVPEAEQKIFVKWKSERFFTYINVSKGGRGAAP